MTVEEWVEYAKRFGVDEVLSIAAVDRESDLSTADVERLAREPREITPGHRLPQPFRRMGRPTEYYRLRTIGAPRTCARCGRPLAGRADKLVCSTACRVALKRERDRKRAS
jgi:hypothetical protein